MPPAGPRTAAGSPGPRRHGPRYAPYFETWTNDTLPGVARASGARDLTLAFLQTPKKGSCSVTWNGIAKDTVRPGGRYAAQIQDAAGDGRARDPVLRRLQRRPGRHGDRRLVPRACPRIARAYESVVTTYGVTRLDMDVEANSLNNAAGIARRSAALPAAPGLGRPDPPPRPDHVHPGRRAVGPARQLPGRAEERRRARRPVHA